MYKPLKPVRILALPSLYVSICDALQERRAHIEGESGPAHLYHHEVGIPLSPSGCRTGRGVNHVSPFVLDPPPDNQSRLDLLGVVNGCPLQNPAAAYDVARCVSWDRVQEPSACQLLSSFNCAVSTLARWNSTSARIKIDMSASTTRCLEDGSATEIISPDSCHPSQTSPSVSYTHLTLPTKA